MSKTFVYVINVDERGQFNADVRNTDDDDHVVFEIESAEHLSDLVSQGLMNSGRDVDGLIDLLIAMGTMKSNDVLMFS